MFKGELSAAPEVKGEISEDPDIKGDRSRKSTGEDEEEDDVDEEEREGGRTLGEFGKEDEGRR